MEISLTQQMDQLFKLKAAHEVVRKKADEAKAKVDEAEKALIDRMLQEGATKGAGKLGTITLSNAVVPQVENWDDFYAFIHKKKYYHLLERRPSVSGCREIFEMSGKLPGVVPFVKYSLRATAAKK